jgi:hypothetical protein
MEKKIHKYFGAVWIGVFGIVIIILINSLNSYGRGMKIISHVKESSTGIYKNMIEAGKFAEKSDFDSAKNLISQVENESEKINQDLWFLSGAEGIQTIKIGKYLTSAATNFLNIIEGINSIGIGFIDINADSPKAYPISNRIAKINAEYSSFIENIDMAEKALSPEETSFLPKKFEEKINTFSAQIKKIKKLMPDTPSFVKGLSAILGENQKQVVLVLLQNDAESRPTGGFIGSVLFTEIQNGKISFKFQDVYDIDRGFKEIVEPPAEIKKLTDKWFFRDSNYSPDFAVSAKKAIWFYEKETGVKVDTVIAINQSLLKNILELTGEVWVPGLNKALNKDNYQTVLSYIIESKLMGAFTPKRILKDFVDEFKSAIFNVKDKKKMLGIIMSEIVNNNILGYSDNADIESLFRLIGMNGEIIKTRENEDYFNVVSVSIGGNKSDAHIEQSVTHTTYVNSDGEINDEVSIERFDNFSRQKEEEIKQTLAKFGYRNVPNWVMDIFGRSKNKAIFRVYIPKGVVLKDENLGIGIKDVKKLYDADLDKDYFSFIMETHPGQTKKAVLRYKLPFKLDFAPAATYRLTAQRQPGLIQTKFTKKMFTEKSLKIADIYPKLQEPVVLKGYNMFSTLIIDN